MVFYNYSKSDKHFLWKIFGKSNSLYSFFYVILKRCSEGTGNGLYKAFNFNILSRILASKKLRSNDRVFSNIQLYIFLNLKKYYSLKNLLRSSKQIEEQSRQQKQQVKLHGHNCTLVPPELSLTTSILLLIKKFALGDNKLTKSVCQGFYTVSCIAKVLKSSHIEIFFKSEILDFLNVVYLCEDNTNAFSFIEIINNLFSPAISILEENLLFLGEKHPDQEDEEFQYIMLPVSFRSKRTYRL